MFRAPRFRRTGRHPAGAGGNPGAVAPSPLGTPRRAVVGWDSGRLAMVLAVLEARCGIAIGANDVYLNVAGGLRISEPAADLAVAAALVSSLTGEPVPSDAVVFGEIGLSGEIRGGQPDRSAAEGSRQAGLREIADADIARQKSAAAGAIRASDGSSLRILKT